MLERLEDNKYILYYIYCNEEYVMTKSMFGDLCEMRAKDQTFEMD